MLRFHGNKRASTHIGADDNLMRALEWEFTFQEALAALPHKANRFLTTKYAKPSKLKLPNRSQGSVDPQVNGAKSCERFGRGNTRPSIEARVCLILGPIVWHSVGVIPDPPLKRNCCTSFYC